jgi:hypothetical protein
VIHAALILIASLLALPDAGTADVPPHPAAAGSAAETHPDLPQETFAIVRRPRASRTKAWIRSRRSGDLDWEANYPEMHFSRFLDLARPAFHPPWIGDRTDRERQDALFRFANAVIMDMRDALHIACPGQRCAPLLVEADRLLSSFLRFGSRAFSYADQRPSGDNWNRWYGWRFAGKEARIDVACDDLLEEPEVMCLLAVELAGGLTLTYNPKNSFGNRLDPADFALHRQGSNEQPLGTIVFERSDTGAPRVALSGAVLASRTHPH